MDELIKLIREKAEQYDLGRLDKAAKTPQGFAVQVVENQRLDYSFATVTDLLRVLNISLVDVLGTVGLNRQVEPRDFMVSRSEKLGYGWLDGLQADMNTLNRVHHVYTNFVDFSNKPAWESFFTRQGKGILLRFVDKSVPIAPYSLIRLLRSGGVVTPLDMAKIIHAPIYSVRQTDEIDFLLVYRLMEMSRSSLMFQSAWAATGEQKARDNLACFILWMWRWIPLSRREEVGSELLRCSR